MKKDYLIMKKDYESFQDTFVEIDGHEQSGPYCPIGRANFIGTVTQVKRPEQYGNVDWIISVRSDTGYTVWGVCPKLLLPFCPHEGNMREMIGNRVSFQASFKPLYGNDLHGQFFNSQNAVTHSTCCRN